MISRIFIKLDCGGEKTGHGKGRKTPNVKKWKKEHILSGYVWFLWRSSGKVLRNPVLDTSARTHTHTHTHTQRADGIRSNTKPSRLTTQDSRKRQCSYSVRPKQVPLTQAFDLQWFYEAHPHRRASQVAQMVKNLPATQETWVWSLGWEDPLKEGMATHSSILAWESHEQRSLEGYIPWGCRD